MSAVINSDIGFSNKKLQIKWWLSHKIVFKPDFTYCFDALMKDRFMNKVKLAKLADKFDVSQHLNLSNGSLFLFLREERTVPLVIYCEKQSHIITLCSRLKHVNNEPQITFPKALTLNISGSVLKFILKF